MCEDNQANWLKFLEKQLLSPSKWQPLFEQNEITCEEELKLCQGEVQVYTALSAQASAMEKLKLKKLLKIDKTPEEEMNKIITESGLIPDIWVENFKRIRVTTPEALVKCGEESYDSLYQFVETQFENKALRRLLRMPDEVKIDPDTRTESSVYRNLAPRSHLASPLPVETQESQTPEETMGNNSKSSHESMDPFEGSRSNTNLAKSPAMPLLNSLPLPSEVSKEQNEAVSLQAAETRISENEKIVKMLQESDLEPNCDTQTSTESMPPLLNSPPLVPVENNEIPKEQMKTNEVVSLQGAETRICENENIVKMLQESGLEPNCDAQTSTESMPPLLNSPPLVPVENNEIPKEQMKTNEVVSLQGAETRICENENIVKMLQESGLEPNCDAQTSTESMPPLLNSPPFVPVENNEIPKEQMKTNEVVSLQGAETRICENENIVKMLQESSGLGNPSVGEMDYDPVQPISYSDFLGKLSFLKYYPQKLTLQESLVVRDNSYSCNSTTDPQMLLLSTLEKIKKSNCNFRKIMLYEKTTHDDDDVPEILVHPMDSLLALIYCSDNFLRQYLYLKLAESQLAVPLLLPDLESNTLTLPLWSLRSIVKEWKVKSISDSSVTSREGRMVNCPAPLISFIRFSHTDKYSKSKILNSVMNDSKHDSFFNHECEGSSVNRQFLNGLVETCWYLPSNMETDAFSDIIMFANLRGNACHYKQQFEFISSHSCMLVVFLAEDDICAFEKRLNQAKSGKCQFLFLMHRCSQRARDRLEELVPNCIVFELYGREPAAVVKYIRSKVVSRLSAQAEGSFFRLSTIVPTPGIMIDETRIASCEQGKKLALRIMDTVKGIDPNEFKEQQLPLQGPDLWHKWADFNKKQNRMKQEEMGNNGPEKFFKGMKMEKETVRRKQLNKIRSLVMDAFIEVLLKQQKQVTLYFLEWLKMSLDDRSREVLPELQANCKTARKDLQKANNDNDLIRQKLKVCDQKLVHASFGLEHLFRELGQIYESVMEMRKQVQPQQIQEVKQLAEVTTDLFLSGYPLEIVDGDASHIPLQWITAILENAKQRLKNAKMAVLSVLGVQSSGKSTLLNTMFGIRFAVSAGRCTRGAFFQIMKLKSSSLPNCQYLLVIDTEGLRAPELDYQQTQQHDNELATLVIGLANMTFVNIQGEVAAEMNDVLHTSVHAFLRMKKVELNPSCLFVRQHVTNVSCNKTIEGNQRLQEQLDDMTQLAARTEHLSGKYQCFNDVITFNNETDVHNFPNLWVGNPPMAPVNPAYCEAAQGLQYKLIKLFQNQDLLCSIDDFKTKVQQLWTAVLRENFIFSFKNILEIEAFAALDREYGKWSWRLENIKLKWEQSVRKRVMPNTKNVESLKFEFVKNVIQQLDEEYGRIMEDFKIFFEYSNPAIASIMKQWNARYEQKLICLRADHVENASIFFRNMIKENQAKVKLEEMKKNARDQFDEHLKFLVLDTVDKKDGDLTNKEYKVIETKFDQHWKKWMDELNADYPLRERINLDDRICQCLREKCQLIQMDSIMIHELVECPLTMRAESARLQLVIDDKRHLQRLRGVIKQIVNYFSQHSSDNAVADKLTKQIFEEVKQYLLENVISHQYDDGHIVYIVRLLLEKIDCSEKHFSSSSFTNEYKVNMILDVASYALKIFTKQQEEAIDNHPVTYLQSLNEQYKKQFKALCSRTAQEKKAALVLVDIVMMQLRKALEDKLILRVADDARRNNPIFSCKIDLKRTVLLRLLKKGDFEAYKTYLTDIQMSYLHWIQLFVEEHCKQSTSSGKRKLVEIAETELKSTANDIIVAANHAYATCSETSQSWLKCFQTKLNDVISFNEEQGHFLIKFPLKGKDRMKTFTEAFVRGIEEEERKHIEKPESNQFFNATTIMAKAVKILCDSVAGCCEQCPFCKEQCEITEKDHKGDHFCILHRPKCLGRYRYEDTQIMVLKICTNLMNSETSFRCAATNHEWVPYKEYRTIYPDWNISAEGTAIAPYWKWFTAKYKDDLIKAFDFKETEIDEDWKCLEKSDAEEDIEKRYRLKHVHN